MCHRAWGSRGLFGYNSSLFCHGRARTVYAVTRVHNSHYVPMCMGSRASYTSFSATTYACISLLASDPIHEIDAPIPTLSACIARLND